MKTWVAHYEFFTGEHDCRSSSIHYAAATKGDAVKDFKRWWDQRHASLPEWFGKFLAVKIYGFEPQPIAADGSMNPSTGMYCYEWKCDFPWAYGTDAKAS